MEETIIAIDPGREKCGIAVVHVDKGVLFKCVIQTVSLATTVMQLAKEYQIKQIVMGDGTSSQESKQCLENIRIDNESLDLVLIDERHSTDEARRRYWQENPPHGFMRLIPVTMQVPPRPVDDYVALILAERFFKKCK